MHRNHLSNIRSLDNDQFSKLMRSLGFATSAVYQLKNDYFVLILKGSDGEKWPAAVKSFTYYNPESSEIGQNLQPGWFGSNTRAQIGSAWFKEWAKGTHFYLPDQSLEKDRFLFTTTTASGKRVKGGELYGILEALAARLRNILGSQDALKLISEDTVGIFLKSLGKDIHNAIDHELRTPLASISGYLSYLKEALNDNKKQEIIHFLGIIEDETRIALEAVERISMSLGRIYPEEKPASINLSSEIEEIIKQTESRVTEVVGNDPSRKISINFKKFIDDRCEILAEKHSFHWALWEVLKNAMLFSKSGQIDMTLYIVDRMVVLDIEDDGLGVPPGSEELIFMRFFQDTRNAQSRKGKRGLGLGLFLARKITEKHFGQLNYMRQKSRSVFRFIWPAHETEISYIEKSKHLKKPKSA